MLRPEVLVGRLGSLRVRIQRCLILLQKFLLDGYIMVGDAENGQPVLWFLDLASFFLHGGYFSYQFVLDEDERLHRVLEGELVLAHLTKNSTNVKVDVRWIQHL